MFSPALVSSCWLENTETGPCGVSALLRVPHEWTVLSRQAHSVLTVPTGPAEVLETGQVATEERCLLELAHAAERVFQVRVDLNLEQRGEKLHTGIGLGFRPTLNFAFIGYIQKLSEHRS